MSAHNICLHEEIRKKYQCSLVENNVLSGDKIRLVEGKISIFIILF